MQSQPLEVREHTPSPRRSPRNARNRRELARHLHGAGDIGPDAVLAIAESAIIAAIERGEVRREDLEAPHWLTLPRKKRRMMERRQAAIKTMHAAGAGGLRRVGIEIDDVIRAAVEAAAQNVRLKLIEGFSLKRLLVHPTKVHRYRPRVQESRAFARNVDLLTSTQRRWTVTSRRSPDPQRSDPHQSHGGVRHRRASGSAPTRRRGSSRSAGGGSSGDDGDGDPEPSGLSPWRHLRNNPNSIYVLIRRAGS